MSVSVSCDQQNLYKVSEYLSVCKKNDSPAVDIYVFLEEKAERMM